MSYGPGSATRHYIACFSWIWPGSDHLLDDGTGLGVDVEGVVDGLSKRFDPRGLSQVRRAAVRTAEGRGDLASGGQTIAQGRLTLGVALLAQVPSNDLHELRDRTQPLHIINFFRNYSRRRTVA